jgi:hypothetical protein
MPTPSPYYGSNYLGLNTGASAFVGADPIYDVAGGYTYYVPYSKAVFGVSGAFEPVSSSNPMPVTVAAGLSATISGFCGTINIQGIGSGTPVPVSGSVVVSGITGAPVYVQTAANCRVEITGGRYLNKLTDSVSVFGPSGNTWIYANLVNASGSAIGTTSNPMQVSFSGVTITANIAAIIGVTNDSPGNGLRIQGMSGGISVPVTVGNTVGINDTAILAGMTSVYGQLVTLNSQILSIAGSVPSTFKTSIVSVTSAAGLIDATGFTCSYGINLKAAASNTQLIYFGNTSGISSTNSYGLDPGEETFVKVNNTKLLYAITTAGTQTLYFSAS